VIPDGGKEIFIFTKMQRLALGPTQPTIQWVVGTVLLFYQRVKWPGHEAEHLIIQH